MSTSCGGRRARSASSGGSGAFSASSTPSASRAATPAASPRGSPAAAPAGGLLSAAAAAAWASVSESESTPALKDAAGVSAEAAAALASTLPSAASSEAAPATPVSAGNVKPSPSRRPSSTAVTAPPPTTTTTTPATRTTTPAAAAKGSISPAPFRRSISGRALAAVAMQHTGGGVSLPPTPQTTNAAGGAVGASTPGATTCSIAVTGGAAAAGPPLSPHFRRSAVQGGGEGGPGSGGDASTLLLPPGPPPLSGPGGPCSATTTPSPSTLVTSAATSAAVPTIAAPLSSVQHSASAGSMSTTVSAGSVASASSSAADASNANGPPPQHPSQQQKQQQQQQQQQQTPPNATQPILDLDPDPPELTSLRTMPLSKLCSNKRGRPQPSKCPLFCAFYAEFDNVVGPKLCYQSPGGFMDCDIGIGLAKVHDMLRAEFDGIYPPSPPPPTEGAKDGDETPAAAGGGDDDPTRDGGGSEGASSSSAVPAAALRQLTMPDIDGPQCEKPPSATAVAAAAGGTGATTGGEVTNSATSSQDGGAAATSGGGGGRPPIPLRRSGSAARLLSMSRVSSSSSLQQQQPDGGGAAGGDSTSRQSSAATGNTSSSQPTLSIFDSTSEYIITGNELADRMICLSTHGMHILTRPTIIKDKRYERNSLLYSVGFVLRRAEDPRPFRPLLSKLASTLHSMEVESRFLSDARTRPQLQRILRGILLSLNSPGAECNMLLDNANVLNLKLFRPPKAPAPPVPDHVVPVLLRPEWQLQTYDWDLTINWIVPHIDGSKYARLISRSSEVDMEMVRACLRVLRHHGVLALVDVFRYSNVYECTPLAASMMAGGIPKLLSAAYRFVSKDAAAASAAFSGSGSAGGNSSRAPTPGPYDHHLMAENPNAPPGSSGGVFGDGGGGGDGDGNAAEGIVRLSTSSVNSSIPPQILASASSFPPRSGDQMRVKAEGSYATGGISASPAGATYGASSASKLSSTWTGTAPASHMESNLNATSTRKKERYMKMALAQLYCACQRDTTLGDMLIDKVLQSTAPAPSSKARQSVPTGGEVGKDEQEHGESGDEFRHQSARSQSPAASRSGLSDSGESGPQSVSNSAPSTPQARVETDTRKSRHSKPTDIDWAEAFEHFDHRRFVTFGVIHGLIRRVHSWPMSFDLNVDEEELSSSAFALDGDDGEGDERSGRTDSHVEEDSLGDGFYYFHNSKSENQPQPASLMQYLSPSLQPVPPSMATTPSPLTPHKTVMAPLSLGTSAAAASTEHEGSGRSSPRKAKHQLKILAKNVAASMDGTRCDDELCCMYQKSMEELIELVGTVGKGVVVVRSTSNTQPV